MYMRGDGICTIQTKIFILHEDTSATRLFTGYLYASMAYSVVCSSKRKAIFSSFFFEIKFQNRTELCYIHLKKPYNIHILVLGFGYLIPNLIPIWIQ